MYTGFYICLCIPSTLHSFGHRVVNKFQKEGEHEGEGEKEERRREGVGKGNTLLLYFIKHERSKIER